MTRGGHLDPPPPAISSTLDCTNLKFCKVLDMPFKVSENTRFVKNLLYGYHGNCLITWCFSLIIVKTSMKNWYFSNAPRNHSSLIFYPLPQPILGLSFKFYYAPLSGHYRSYISQNFVFKTYAYPKLSRKNLSYKKG